MKTIEHITSTWCLGHKRLYELANLLKDGVFPKDFRWDYSVERTEITSDGYCGIVGCAWGYAQILWPEDTDKVRGNEAFMGHFLDVFHVVPHDPVERVVQIPVSRSFLGNASEFFEISKREAADLFWNERLATNYEGICPTMPDVTSQDVAVAIFKLLKNKHPEAKRLLNI